MIWLSFLSYTTQILGLEPQVIVILRLSLQLQCIIVSICAVTGEANFSMPSTSLTVGGFNQPLFSRTVMETPGNAEKGISQRFLWLIPKPVYSKFDSLQPIDKDFVDNIGKHSYKLET